MNASDGTQPRRDRLIVATKELLAEHEDIRHATTSRVAKLAGVAVGTIYNHFIDVDDLVAFVIADLLESESPSLGQTLQKQATQFRPGVLSHLEREQNLRSSGRAHWYER
jgi:AcrR family transcriptional regulator